MMIDRVGNYHNPLPVLSVGVYVHGLCDGDTPVPAQPWLTTVRDWSTPTPRQSARYLTLIIR